MEKFDEGGQSKKPQAGVEIYMNQRNTFVFLYRAPWDKLNHAVTEIELPDGKKQFIYTFDFFSPEMLAELRNVEGCYEAVYDEPEEVVKDAFSELNKAMRLEEGLSNTHKEQFFAAIYEHLRGNS